MKHSFLLIVFFLNFSFKSFGKTRVWIDYDVAFGKVFRDVDDGLALSYALVSPEIEVKGISLVYGNIKNLNSMKRITKRILKRTRQKIPIFKGTKKPRSQMTLTPACSALGKTLKTSPLTILAMGRLTNVACVINFFPDQLKNINKIIIMGGRKLRREHSIAPQNIFLPDTNIDHDVGALKKILATVIPLVIIPTESMGHLQVTKPIQKELKKNKSSIGNWLARKSNLWRILWKLFFKTKGFIPFDLFLVTYLTHPQDFKCESTPTKIMKLRDDTKRLPHKLKKRPKLKPFLVSSHQLGSLRTANYCSFISPDHLEKVLRRFY